MPKPRKTKIAGSMRFFWMNLLSRDMQISLLRFFSKARFLRKTLAFTSHLSAYKKVLVILPDRPFEVTFTQKCILALKEHRPDIVVEVIAETSAKDIVRSNPAVDSGIFYAAKEYTYDHPAFRDLIRAIKDRGYDACFLMKQEPSPLDLLLTAMSGAPLRVGFPGKNVSPFINLSVRPRKETLYEGAKYEALFRALGIKLSKAKPKWNIPKSAEKDIEGILAEAGYRLDRPLVGIDLAPSIHGNALSDEAFAPLISGLAAAGNCETVLFYSNTLDKPLIKEFGGVRKNVVSIPTDKITSVAAFISRLSVTVAPNNMLYQLAVMLSCPVVGLFESLDHRRWALQEEGLLEVVTATRLKNIAVPEMVEKVKGLLGKN